MADAERGRLQLPSRVCGGAGGFQLGLQNAETNQGALGLAFSNQNAVNSNTPHSVAGGNIYGGSSYASQTPHPDSASTGVSNNAETRQGQWLNQQDHPLLLLRTEAG